MFTLVRATVYATLFVGLVLIFLPSRLLSWSGVARPETIGFQEIIGLAIGVAGAALAAWCVLTFALLGRGTPAPFDPPRRLVVRGPYRFVRNPMYIGAGAALGGAALFYASWPLLGYVGLFFLASHLFIRLYEEPALRRQFGEEYENYCRRVRRWRPKIRAPRDTRSR